MRFTSKEFAIKRAKYSRGFSLVELMIAMLIGIFLTGSLVHVLLTSTQSANSVDTLSRLQENGRIGIEMLSTDLRRSGYLGGNSDFNTISGTAGQTVSAATCDSADTSWGLMLRQNIFGLNDTNAGYGCISNSDYLRGDVLTLRYTAPWPETGALDADRLYLRSSIFKGKAFIGSDQGDVDNIVEDTKQSTRQLIALSYYVGPTGRSCNGQVIPALFRKTLDENGLPVAQELIAGIEDFQLSFRIDNQYYNADGVADWNTVNSVQIWLLARAECADNSSTDTNTYVMGDQNYTPNDNFQRRMYSTVVSMRN